MSEENKAGLAAAPAVTQTEAKVAVEAETAAYHEFYCAEDLDGNNVRLRKAHVQVIGSTPDATKPYKSWVQMIGGERIYLKMEAKELVKKLD